MEPFWKATLHLFCTSDRENESEMECDFKGMSLHHSGEGLVLGMAHSIKETEVCYGSGSCVSAKEAESTRENHGLG